MSTRRDWLRMTAALGLQQAAARARGAGPGDVHADGSLKLLAGTSGLAELRPVVNRHRDLLDLGGLWQFQTDPAGVGETQGWMHRLPTPRQIAVPGSWNDQWPDLAHYLGAAWYLTSVELPEGWREREIRLRIESATHAATAWLDGTRLGSHEGGHLPFEFALDSHPALAASLRSGRALTLAIRIDHEPDPLRVPPGRIGPDDAAGNSPNVAYDFFPYAGLDRRVLLAAVPPVRISDYHAQTRLHGADALVDLVVGATRHWNGRGRAWLSSGTQRHEVALRFVGGQARAQWRVPQARLWQPADPHLYRLTIELADAAVPGRSLDAYSDEQGLRTVQVQGDRLLLNGQPIRLLGFGRHEDAPGSGRGLNLPVAVQDLALLRWTGANSFRTSHYPYSEETLRMAEREGLMVIAETPAVGLHFSDSPAAIAARLARAKRQTLELIARDRNRACVIMWSLANEPMDDGFTAKVMKGPVVAGNEYQRLGQAFFDALFDLARSLDVTRPLTVVGAGFSDPSWWARSDVICLNRYAGWYDRLGRLSAAMADQAREIDRLHAASGKPLMFTEFGADALPGHHSVDAEPWSEEFQREMIKRYLDLAESRPWVVGLHVWNLADFRTASALGRAGGINHKGVFTRDRRPKLAAHYLRERWGGGPAAGLHR
jgi:beta-glucuronidase